MIYLKIHIDRKLVKDIHKDPPSRPKIGVIVATDNRIKKVEAMRRALEDYGYRSEDIDFIVKNAKGNKKKLPELAQELVEAGVDLIVTTGTFETYAAQSQAQESEIPIVFIGVSCTVELGIVDNKISPGFNITGVDSHYVQLSGKRLEFLKRIVPTVEKVLVLYNPSTIPFDPSAEILCDAADKLDITLEFISIDSSAEIMKAIEENHGKVDGAMLMCSLLFESAIEDIVAASIRYKLPVVGVDDTQVEKGILAFYGSTNENDGIQGARLVANILNGQDPKMIPIEFAEILDLHINVDTAEALGIKIDYDKMTYVNKFVRNSER